MPGTFNVDLTKYKITSHPYPAVTVTSSAKIDTYGSYVEMIAASAISSDFYLVGVEILSTGPSMVLDIAVGAEEAEESIAEILTYIGSSGLEQHIPIDPILIAADSRVSARVKDNEAAANGGQVALIVKEVM